MTPKQALAWLEKHGAMVSRGFAPLPIWCVSLSQGNSRVHATTLVEAVEKARDAITKRFVVQSSNDDSGESSAFDATPVGDERAHAEARRRRLMYPNSAHVVVRIVRKVKR